MNEHILVVDDEPPLLFTNTFLLRKAGYRVSQAEDGEEALARINEAQEKGALFDLLLTDITMPRMSGIELIDELHKRGILLPTFVVSGMADEKVIDKLLNNGCMDFLMKPYDFRELISRVHAILKHPKQERSRSFFSEVEGTVTSQLVHSSGEIPGSGTEWQ